MSNIRSDILKLMDEIGDNYSRKDLLEGLKNLGKDYLALESDHLSHRKADKDRIKELEKELERAVDVIEKQIKLTNRFNINEHRLILKIEEQAKLITEMMELTGFHRSYCLRANMQRNKLLEIKCTCGLDELIQRAKRHKG